MKCDFIQLVFPLPFQPYEFESEPKTHFLLVIFFALLHLPFVVFNSSKWITMVILEYLSAV